MFFYYLYLVAVHTDILVRLIIHLIYHYMTTHGIFTILGGTYILFILGGALLYFIGRYIDRKYGDKFYQDLEDELNNQ